MRRNSVRIAGRAARSGKTRIPNFDFEMMGLVGQTLYFAPDETDKTVCKVVSARSVSYRGAEMSYSEACRRATQDLGVPARKDGLPRPMGLSCWVTEAGDSVPYLWGEIWRRIER